MTCQSSISGSVNKKSFSWSWYVDLINGNELEEPIYIGMTGSHTYYILLATPQQPMSIPWTDVLDYACVWAAGQTSEDQAVTLITTKAYTNFGKNYDGGGTHAPGTTFHLTSLLASSWADCRDMSATVHVFTRAIGGTQTDVRMINDPNPYVENFKYKSIDPVGNPSWQTRWWNFHQVANYSGVYDACLRLNQSNPRIPTGEDINGGYKTDLFDPVSGSVWVPKTPFIYITVD
jgi:hypothetical protein